MIDNPRESEVRDRPHPKRENRRVVVEQEVDDVCEDRDPYPEDHADDCGGACALDEGREEETEGDHRDTPDNDHSHLRCE